MAAKPLHQPQRKPEDPQPQQRAQKDGEALFIRRNLENNAIPAPLATSTGANMKDL